MTHGIQHGGPSSPVVCGVPRESCSWHGPGARGSLQPRPPAGRTVVCTAGPVSGGGGGALGGWHGAGLPLQLRGRQGSPVSRGAWR
jgi:hypothetical protein